MGTKVRANTSNDMKSFLQENQTVKNGQYQDSLMSQKLTNAHLGCSVELVRQKILEHESIFKDQLQELHRLYKRQTDLMNDIRRRELYKNQMEACSTTLFPPIPAENAKTKLNVPEPLFLHPIVDQQSVSGPNAGKPHLGFLVKGTPVFTLSGNKNLESLMSMSMMQKRMFDLETPANRYMHDTVPSLAQVGSSSMMKNHDTLHKIDERPSLNGVCIPRAKSDFYLGRPHKLVDLNDPIPGDETSAGMSGNVTCLRRADWSPNVNLSSTPVKDFFHVSLDEKNREKALSDLVSQSRMNQKIQVVTDPDPEKNRYEAHSRTGGFSSGNSSTFTPTVLAKPRSDFLTYSPSDHGKSTIRRKSTLFGVEISEGNNDPAYAPSKTSSQTHENGSIKSKSPFVPLAPDKKLKSLQSNDCIIGSVASHVISNSSVQAHDFVLNGNNERSDTDRPIKQPSNEGRLPWFLRGPRGDAKTNVTESSYFMNIESLQTCSQNFFKKAEPMGGPSNQKLEFSSDVNKVLSLNQFEAADSVSYRGSGNNGSGLRQHIDLNLSLDDEEALSPPSLLTTVLIIASTEIDLETPATDSGDELSVEKSGHYEECVRIAAEAIMVMSGFGERILFNNNTRELEDVASTDCLKWFAIIASSFGCGNESLVEEVLQCSSGTSDEELVPHGMDYFEYMTLKLKDNKDKLYPYLPVLLDKEKDEDMGAAAASSCRRARRGQGRKGRQRKEFQRDILPSLVALSRHEMTEDFQSFEEQLKAQGCVWQSRLSQRNAAKRRKCWGEGTVSPIKGVCPSLIEAPSRQEGGLEEGSLKGWGKKTRRLPRLRCSNAYAAAPLKC